MTSLIAGFASLDVKDGYLPLWMAFISGVAAFNSVQNFLTTSLTKRVYSETNQGGFTHT